MIFDLRHTFQIFQRRALFREITPLWIIWRFILGPLGKRRGGVPTFPKEAWGRIVIQGRDIVCGRFAMRRLLVLLEYFTTSDISRWQYLGNLVPARRIAPLGHGAHFGEWPLTRSVPHPDVGLAGGSVYEVCDRNKIPTQDIYEVSVLCRRILIGRWVHD